MYARLQYAYAISSGRSRHLAVTPSHRDSPVTRQVVRSCAALADPISQQRGQRWEEGLEGRALVAVWEVGLVMQARVSAR